LKGEWKCDRAGSRNAKKAGQIIEKWRTPRGLPEAAKHYIREHHKQLAAFLKSHHHIETSLAEDIIPRDVPEPTLQDRPRHTPSPIQHRGHSNDVPDGGTAGIPVIQASPQSQRLQREPGNDESLRLVPEIPTSNCTSPQNSPEDSCDTSWVDFDDLLPIDVPDSDGDIAVSDSEDESRNNDLHLDIEQMFGFLDKAPFVSSTPVNGGSGNSLPHGWRKYSPLKTRATHRQAFEKIKAALCLSDEEMSKILKIWKNLKPREDWDNFVIDGRLLARPALQHMRGIKPRTVVCGLKKPDLVPFKMEDRERKLELYKTIGSTVHPNLAKAEGDCIDFDFEKCMLLQSPGNLNPGLFLKFLQRVHAARPNLLSADFVKLADPDLFYNEKETPNPLRSKMNYFLIKWHLDGIQIAKNSTSSEGKPICFMIDSIYPYDPETKKFNETAGLRIPPSLTSVITITVYHGRGKCCQFQFAQHWKSEEWRLHIENNDPDVLRKRRMVIGYRLTIADSPERSLNLGKPIKQTQYTKEKEKSVQLTIFL
jgi:hypothetical protein